MTSMIADAVKIAADGEVYYPREDSYLLASAVERYAFGKVLDVGTGSGIQGIVAAKKGCEVTFSDISERALERAESNAAANSVTGEFIRSDLFSSITERFNTVVFNPPYLPSSAKRDIALDGGKRGRELIDRFISGFRGHVEERHAVLMLESSLNGYGADIKRLNAEIVARQRLFFEELVVLMFR